MGEKKEAPKLSTQGEGTPSISSLVPASTLESVGAFPVPLHLSTSVVASGMMLVSHEFL